MKDILIHYGPFLEEWRLVKDFEDRYEVSNYGRVRSFDIIIYAGRGLTPKYRKGKILKAGKHKGGYEIVTLSKNAILKTQLVHRLVAKSFVENTMKKPEVNHINAIKNNNAFYNLEWVTSSENTIHGLKMGIMNTAKGSQKKNSVLNEENVINIKKMFLDGYSNKEISILFNVAVCVIREIKINKNWKHIKI